MDTETKSDNFSATEKPDATARLEAELAKNRPPQKKGRATPFRYFVYGFFLLWMSGCFISSSIQSHIYRTAREIRQKQRERERPEFMTLTPEEFSRLPPEKKATVMGELYGNLGLTNK